MRIVFVRHGQPDYQKDCLIEKGRMQAEAAAERLAEENIRQIFSSTFGRAMETAECTAKKIGISKIIPCDFMCELSWERIEGDKLQKTSHPWAMAERVVVDGKSLMESDWMREEPFAGNTLIDLIQNAEKGFDELLASLGYRREGDYYRVEANTEETIAVFSHAGSSSAVLGHMFNLPFPFMCGAMAPKCAAVTVVKLAGEDGTLVSPKFEVFNDDRHLAGITEITNRFITGD